jgi:hypothetical protein
LSVGAVHACLRSARRKLQCATIEQAVAKAIRLDLVLHAGFLSFRSPTRSNLLYFRRLLKLVCRYYRVFIDIALRLDGSRS